MTGRRVQPGLCHPWEVDSTQWAAPSLQASHAVILFLSTLIIGIFSWWHHVRSFMYTYKYIYIYIATSYFLRIWISTVWNGCVNLGHHWQTSRLSRMLPGLWSEMDKLHFWLLMRCTVFGPIFDLSFQQCLLMATYLPRLIASLNGAVSSGWVGELEPGRFP